MGFSQIAQTGPPSHNPPTLIAMTPKQSCRPTGVLFPFLAVWQQVDTHGSLGQAKHPKGQSGAFVRNSVRYSPLWGRQPYLGPPCTDDADSPVVSKFVDSFQNDGKREAEAVVFQPGFRSSVNPGAGTIRYCAGRLSARKTCAAARFLQLKSYPSTNPHPSYTLASLKKSFIVIKC